MEKQAALQIIRALAQGIDPHMTGRGDDADLAGLREYQRGDPLQRVAWKAVARGAGWFSKSFEGIVTGASEKGTWVRILQPMVEGKVVRGFERLDVGDRVVVKLLDTDVQRGFIDFAFVSRAK